MYSENINKICNLCVWGHHVKGSATHMQCSLIGGFFPIGHSCINFKYDILKKNVRRKKDVSKLGFTASDFSLD